MLQHFHRRLVMMMLACLCITLFVLFAQGQSGKALRGDVASGEHVLSSTREVRSSIAEIVRVIADSAGSEPVTESVLQRYDLNHDRLVDAHDAAMIVQALQTQVLAFLTRPLPLPPACPTDWPQPKLARLDTAKTIELSRVSPAGNLDAATALREQEIGGLRTELEDGAWHAVFALNRVPEDFVSARSMALEATYGSIGNSSGGDRIDRWHLIEGAVNTREHWETARLRIEGSQAQRSDNSYATSLSMRIESEDGTPLTQDVRLRTPYAQWNPGFQILEIIMTLEYEDGTPTTRNIEGATIANALKSGTALIGSSVLAAIKFDDVPETFGSATRATLHLKFPASGKTMLEEVSFKLQATADAVPEGMDSPSYFCGGVNNPMTFHADGMVDIPCTIPRDHINVGSPSGALFNLGDFWANVRLIILRNDISASPLPLSHVTLVLDYVSRDSRNPPGTIQLSPVDVSGDTLGCWRVGI